MTNTIYIQFSGSAGSGRTTLQRLVKELLYKNGLKPVDNGEHQLKLEVHSDFLKELHQYPQEKLAE